jgi:hypothetical protein
VSTPRKYGYRRSPPGSRGTHTLAETVHGHVRASADQTPTNNRRTIVDILNQFGLGSCELNAAVQLFRMRQIIEQAQAYASAAGVSFEVALTKVMELPPALAARLFWYLAAQSVGGYAGQGDTGTCSADVTAALALVGVPKESDNPYTDDSTKIDPGTLLEALKRLAADQRCDRTARVDADDMPLEACKSATALALTSQFPILLAMPVTSKFENLMPGEVWAGPADGSQVVGGHGVTLVDQGPASELSQYATSREFAYLICNSWGDAWCDGGLCLMAPTGLDHRYDEYIFKGVPQWSGTK